MWSLSDKEVSDGESPPSMLKGGLSSFNEASIAPGGEAAVKILQVPQDPPVSYYLLHLDRDEGVAGFVRLHVEDEGFRQPLGDHCHQGILTARCSKDGHRFWHPPAHQLADPRCLCGVRLEKSLPERPNILSNRHAAVAVVLGWGRTVVTRFGLVCEKAEVTALAYHSGQWVPARPEEVRRRATALGVPFLEWNELEGFLRGVDHPTEVPLDDARELPYPVLEAATEVPHLYFDLSFGRPKVTYDMPSPNLWAGRGAVAQAAALAQIYLTTSTTAEVERVWWPAEMNDWATEALGCWARLECWTLQWRPEIRPLRLRVGWQPTDNPDFGCDGCGKSNWPGSIGGMAWDARGYYSSRCSECGRPLRLSFRKRGVR